ncbi:alpha/beta fold hydrolase [Agromyces seonyuensis]|uniref:Alpha/beta fold hydrolase n=1 Tax=Agromyces seonyuensis TaxID=2662446 RepID=A0A6I4NWB5_9MICO|nr:alpha/beta hydrolase [Agromyces seonyuensis]MWB98431.1 alpha/beta fold hydrolase [Agromyces seonyuensis]
MSANSPYDARLRRIPTREHRAGIAGAETRWWEYGEPDSDTTLVFVHGFRGDHHGLEPVIAFLPGVRILAPDLPGFGASGALPVAHDIDGYAGWLDAFIAAQALPEPPVVLGHSFGSIVVAAAVADGLPAERVILVNPIGAPALEGPRGVMTRLAVLYYRVAAALPAKAGFALLRSRLIVRVMSVTMAKTKDRELLAFIHDQHDRYFSAFEDRSVVLEAFRASVSNDVRASASKIAQPVLLVAADLDDITPIEAERRLATMFADARLVEIPGVGHLIHYETPEPAAAAIAAFLGERDGAPGDAGEADAAADASEPGAAR